ncbi:unnamed protein product [Camellia sinensis]
MMCRVCRVNSKDEVSFAIVDSEAIAREEKRGFENGTPKFAKIWSPCYAFEVFPGVLSVFRKI